METWRSLACSRSRAIRGARATSDLDLLVAERIPPLSGYAKSPVGISTFTLFKSCRCWWIWLLLPQCQPPLFVYPGLVGM
jgi:hypothetical protein